MSSKGRLLIVDDEPAIRRILQVAFEKAGYEPHIAESAEEALTIVEKTAFQCVLTDVTMPGMNGYELLGALGKRFPDLPVIIMTAYGTIPQAVQAIRNGAFEYVTKPFDLEHLKRVVGSATASSEVKKPAKAKSVTRQSGLTKPLIAASKSMIEVFEMVQQVADSRATVLITGESGVGKEVVAHALHELSPRSKKPFVALSCAAIPESLLESELFGYEKGAFTGAAQSKAGRFELAHDGSLFLDEIGEIPMITQVKLLRVLQERSFERLGSDKPTSVDVRLITATNRDLGAMVERGEFRLDLMYRLQVVELHIPPLRERVEDIEPLARHFLSKFCRDNNRSLLDLDDEVISKMVAYSWPGNVRELENTMERAVVFAPKEGDRVLPKHLPPSILRAA